MEGDYYSVYVDNVLTTGGPFDHSIIILTLGAHASEGLQLL